MIGRYRGSNRPMPIISRLSVHPYFFQLALPKKHLAF